MAFRVGQKVGCIDAGGNHHLAVGGKYTITGLDDRWPEQVGLFLAEVAHSHGTPFYSRRFRLLVEKSTDAGMAVLREILDRESHDERKPVRVTQ